jgi:O-antigen/teichoic acid export membrane protein
MSVVALAFLCIPLIVGRVGNEQFGLLSLLWMFVGYFGVFDLGLGQASVKFLSESVTRADARTTAAIIRATGWMSLSLGLASGLAVMGIAAYGVDRFLTISPAFTREATRASFILALGLPAVLLQSSLRAVPTAFNRFDIVNALQALGGVLQWVGASVAVLCGGELVAVVIVTVAARYVLAGLYVYAALRFVPEILRSGGTGPSTVVPTLLGFGGWVSVNQIAAPLLLFVERLMIGGVLGLAAVTFYAVPAETVSRILVIPMSMVSALFPMISGGWVTEQGRVHARSLYQRSVKYVALLLLPLVFCLIMFSGEILRLWLGVEFGRQSAVVLSVLSAGVFFNALAQLPFAALQALGRPEVPARIALVQIPLYVVLLYMLMRPFGINGIAIAWFVRVATETAALFYYVHVAMHGVPRTPMGASVRLPVAVICGGVVFVLLAGWLSGDLVLRVASGFLVVAVYAVTVWKSSLDLRDRETLALVMGKFVRKRRGT